MYIYMQTIRYIIVIYIHISPISGHQLDCFGAHGHFVIHSLRERKRWLCFICNWCFMQKSSCSWRSFQNQRTIPDRHVPMCVCRHAVVERTHRSSRLHMRECIIYVEQHIKIRESPTFSWLRSLYKHWGLRSCRCIKIGGVLCCVVPNITQPSHEKNAADFQWPPVYRRVSQTFVQWKRVNLDNCWGCDGAYARPYPENDSWKPCLACAPPYWHPLAFHRQVFLCKLLEYTVSQSSTISWAEAPGAIACE